MSEFGPGGGMEEIAAAHEAKMRAQAEAQQPEKGSGEVDLETADFDQLFALAEASEGNELSVEEVTELNNVLNQDSAKGNYDSLRAGGFIAGFDGLRGDVEGRLIEHPIQQHQDACAETIRKANELRSQLESLKDVSVVQLSAEEKNRIFQLLNESLAFSGRQTYSSNEFMLSYNEKRPTQLASRLNFLKESVAEVRRGIEIMDEESAMLKGEEVHGREKSSSWKARMEEKLKGLDEKIKGNLVKMLERNKVDGQELAAQIEAYVQENEPMITDAESLLREAERNRYQTLVSLGDAYDAPRLSKEAG